MKSALASLILHLHQQAQAEGRITERYALADAVLAVLTNGPTPDVARPSDGECIGRELYSGRTASVPASVIRRRAGQALTNYTVFLAAVDTLGYTPQVVKAAVGHWQQLEDADLGEDGNCVLLDIRVALTKASEPTRKTIALLQAGIGPRRVGELLGENGTRLVGKAYLEVSRLLEAANGKANTSQPGVN